jgi:hypothetical protein
MPCTTHHYACACREESFKELLCEVMRAHADPDNPEYNECDIEPCEWCTRAGELILYLPTPKNQHRGQP